MEKHFFTWENWEEADTGIMQFTTCKLTVPLSEFPVGHEVAMIEMNYQEGVMNFWGGENDDQIIASFKLHLSAIRYS